MRVEVINTGTELLLGQVVNTHVGYFGERLLEIGLRIAKQTAIPDGEAIKAELDVAMKDAGVVLVTGGLGPTSDDITRELTAELLGLAMVEDDEVTAAIRRRVEKYSGKPMSEINRRQAMVPQRAEVLRNDWGTAPGLYLPAGLGGRSAHAFLLPGPPRELKPMFEGEVLPRLRAMQRQAGTEVPVCRNHFFMGLGESDLASRLAPVLDGVSDDFELGYCLKAGGVIVRCIGAAGVVDALSEPIRSASPEDYVGELGGEPTIEAAVVGQLGSMGQRVATAESCTGGLIAARITDIPGSSDVFGHGFVTYANAAKHEVLGVGEKTLEAHGAVSEPVIREMVEGCLRRSGADHALAVSGIAGPGGGSVEKPVGTVWIGLASSSKETLAMRFEFVTDRLHFKQRTADKALDLLRRRLSGYL
jgi:nicotinamide-nucleotide amidase